MSAPYVSRLIVLSLVASFLMLAAGSGGAHAAENPRVLPPQSNPHGMSYGEWSGAWWAWVTAQPASVNPVLDPTGANCAQGQAGQVWFLAGTFGGTVVRSCTIPSGTSLFFPLANLETDNFPTPPSTEPTQLSVDQLTAKCLADIGSPALSAEVDGSAIENLLDYAVEPTLFQYTVPSGDDSLYDFFGLPDVEGPTPPPGAVSCGYYLMLAPLPPGQHTIHFAAAGFLDVTYNLTVVPRGQA